MEAKIVSITRPDVQEWEQLWNSCPYATYFHSPEWAHIWQHYSEGKISPAPVLLAFNDGKKALLPFSIEKACKGLVKSTLSSPAGTYGGWISTDRLAPEHEKSVWQYILREYPNLIIRTNPYYANNSAVPVVPCMDDVTHHVPMDGPFEKIEKEWRKGHRSAVHKAARLGVTVREASSMNDWETYGLLYKDSLRRWGERASSNYRQSLFSIMGSLNSSRIKLWLAQYEGNIVAGALCLYSRHHVVYWHGAALDKYYFLNPVNYLVYDIMMKASREGYAWFDFNPSAGHAGVIKFKQGFNPRISSCPVYITQTFSKRLYCMFSSRIGGNK